MHAVLVGLSSVLNERNVTAQITASRSDVSPWITDLTRSLHTQLTYLLTYYRTGRVDNWTPSCDVRILKFSVHVSPQILTTEPRERNLSLRSHSQSLLPIMIHKDIHSYLKLIYE